MKPIVIVNFKTYPQATGENAVKLARLCALYSKKYDIRVAVQTTDIAQVSKAVRIPVYAQHTDFVEPGKTTGWTTVHAIKQAGAKGSLLNHAEHRLGAKYIESTTALLKKERLDAIVCAEKIVVLKTLRKINATIYSYEPPELIGGNVSVSKAKPDTIKKSVLVTKNILVGAGIKTKEDLRIALELGAKGVLLSSHIVLAKDQKKALKGLLG